jgi:hypothetical protein
MYILLKEAKACAGRIGGVAFWLCRKGTGRVRIPVEHSCVVACWSYVVAMLELELEGNMHAHIVAGTLHEEYPDRLRRTSLGVARQ